MPPAKPDAARALFAGTAQGMGSHGLSAGVIPKTMRLRPTSDVRMPQQVWPSEPSMS